MSEIWLRAFGGTGGLMARAFVNLLLLSPLNDTDKEIVIQLMDYDELPPANKEIGNDLSILNDLVTCYKALHNLHLNGLAANPIRLESGQLKGIREVAYGFNSTTAQDFDYSLLSLFGPQNATILRSCLKSLQIEAPNKDGAYGDLARNGIIAKPMEVSSAFKPTYTGFDHNNTIVMYLGSTDGGVGNTLLDPDLNSLINFIASNAWPTDKSRDYRVYSFRTLPYKKFTPENPDPIKAANARRILEEMVPQSKGVINNLDTREDYVRTANITAGVPYKLDALFLAGYAVNDRSQFDDTNAPGTNSTSNPDSQTHRSHIVELVSALMMVDCLNEDICIPTEAKKLIYGYDVEAEQGSNCIKDNMLISTYTTKFTPSVYTISDTETDTPGVNLLQKITAAVFSYAFLLKLQADFKAIKSNPGNYRLTKKILGNCEPIEELVQDIYDVRVIGGGTVDTNQLGVIADVFTTYLSAMKKLVKFIYEVQETSRFGSPNSISVNILPHEGLKALVEPEEHTEYYFSSTNLWIPRGDNTDYERILDCLSECPNIGYITVDNDNHDRTDDEAAKELLNAIYEMFLHIVLGTIEDI